ncbi:MAG: S8 family serine peptidase [Pseudomonadota bacterium]|nr:S8 family serine peptidase [Pseudomonadota bacterium]
MKIPAALITIAMCACLFCCCGGVALADTEGPDGRTPPARQLLVMLRLPTAHFRSDGNYGNGWDAQLGRHARRRVAEALASDLQLRVGAEWSMTSLGLDCFVMELPSGADAPALQRALERRPEVESVEPMHEYHALEAVRTGRGLQAPDSHDDPLYALQPTARRWHLAELHAVSTGRGVTVAVIDSGVDSAHIELHGHVAVNRDFVATGSVPAEDHGTAVAGIIAAIPDNHLGIAGVAPAVRLLALRACGQAGEADATVTRCNSFALAKALQTALDERADVINLSLAGPDDRLLARLIDVALARGACVVAAADPHAAGGSFPASHAGVVAVRGEDQTVPPTALPAPGQDIPTTLPGERWGFVSGSSFAAAEVSGLVALLRELERAGPQADAWWSSGAAAPGSARRTEGKLLDPCALAAALVHNCVCACADHVDNALPHDFSRN